MSLRCYGIGSRVMLTGSLLVFFLSLISIAAYAQQENPPKVDIFAGYQWLNPGGHVPSDAAGTILSSKTPSLARGFGLALGVNPHPNVGLEFDFGYDRHSGGLNDSTVSVGPRFTWRTEGVNFFGHTLVG